MLLILWALQLLLIIVDDLFHLSVSSTAARRCSGTNRCRFSESHHSTQQMLLFCIKGFSFTEPNYLSTFAFYYFIILISVPICTLSSSMILIILRYNIIVILIHIITHTVPEKLRNAAASLSTIVKYFSSKWDFLPTRFN